MACLVCPVVFFVFWKVPVLERYCFSDQSVSGLRVDVVLRGCVIAQDRKVGFEPSHHFLAVD